MAIGELYYTGTELNPEPAGKIMNKKTTIKPEFNEQFRDNLARFERYVKNVIESVVEDVWNVSLKIYGDAYWGSVGTNPGWEGKEQETIINAARFIRDRKGNCVWLYWRPEWECWTVESYQPGSRTIGYNIYKVERAVV